MYFQNRDGTPMFVFSLERIMAIPSKELPENTTDIQLTTYLNKLTMIYHERIGNNERDKL